MDDTSSVVTDQANNVTEVKVFVEEKITDPVGMHAFEV
jgi:hypothetical protein